jgi:hypothetical protein
MKLRLGQASPGTEQNQRVHTVNDKASLRPSTRHFPLSAQFPLVADDESPIGGPLVHSGTLQGQLLHDTGM